MKWLRNLSVQMTLILGFLSINVLTAMMGGFALYQASRLNAVSVEINTNWLPCVRSLGEIRGQANNYRRSQLQLLVSKEQREKDESERRMETTKSQLETELKTYEPLINSPEEQKTYDSFKAHWQEYMNASPHLLALVRANKEVSDQVLEDTRAKINLAMDDIAQLTEINNKGSLAEGVRGKAIFSSAIFWIISLTVMCVVVGLVLAVLTARQICIPLSKLVVVMQGVQKGDLTQQADIQSTNELGQIGQALNSAILVLRETDELRAKQLAAADENARQSIVLESVLTKVAENASAMAAASEELSAVSAQMSSYAEATSTQSSVVSAASSQVSTSTQTVAAGVEEMGASIKEISKNAIDAARIATSAVKIAHETNETITKLGDSSNEIGNIIKVITSIAQQTNLLALNATIEAARAGEAGKGFAVVANEVKELAKETAKATEDISAKIEAIQSDTKGAIDAISHISGVINQINDISSTIASAIEEQTATTNEISRSVSEASRGTAEIAENITSVAQAAKCTTDGADNSKLAAEELARMAAELQEMVADFNGGNGEKRTSKHGAEKPGRPQVRPVGAQAADGHSKAAWEVHPQAVASI